MKLMNTQNKPNMHIPQKYNHRGDDTEEVVLNVNAEYILPKKAKPPDRNNPESKLRRRAGKNVLSDNRVWFKQVLVEAIKQTSNRGRKTVYDDNSSSSRRAPSSPKEKCVAGASSRVLVSEAPGWYLITSVNERGDQICQIFPRICVLPRCDFQRPVAPPYKPTTDHGSLLNDPCKATAHDTCGAMSCCVRKQSNYARTSYCIVHVQPCRPNFGKSGQRVHQKLIFARHQIISLIADEPLPPQEREKTLLHSDLPPWIHREQGRL